MRPELLQRRAVLTAARPDGVHRFAQGDRVQLVLAASDATYKGFGIPTPITVTDSPQRRTC